MSHSKPLLDRVLGLLIELGPVEAKRLFGGTGLSLDGITFAFLMPDGLYLRVDDRTRPALEAAGAVPFRYSTRLREVTVQSYYRVPEPLLRDGERLTGWATDALAAAKRNAAGRNATKRDKRRKA